MGVVLAVHTAGCGSTEPPAGNRSEPPVSDEAEQNGVGNQEDNMSAEDRAQMETADTDGSNILIAYLLFGELSAPRFFTLNAPVFRMVWINIQNS